MPVCRVILVAPNDHRGIRGCVPPIVVATRILTQQVRLPSNQSAAEVSTEAVWATGVCQLEDKKTYDGRLSAYSASASCERAECHSKEDRVHILMR
jgi:hypothetical protein